jgi:hypothetical protein
MSADQHLDPDRCRKIMLENVATENDRSGSTPVIDSIGTASPSPEN